MHRGPLITFRTVVPLNYSYCLSSSSSFTNTLKAIILLQLCRHMLLKFEMQALTFAASRWGTADTEIKVPFAENQEISKIPSFKLGLP